MQRNIVYRHEVNQELQINVFQSQFGKCFVKYNKTTIVQIAVIWIAKYLNNYHEIQTY